MEMYFKYTYNYTTTISDALKLFSFCFVKNKATEMFWEIGKKLGCRSAISIAYPPPRLSGEFSVVIITSYHACGLAGHDFISSSIPVGWWGVPRMEGRMVVVHNAQLHLFFSLCLCQWKSFTVCGSFCNRFVDEAREMHPRAIKRGEVINFRREKTVWLSSLNVRYLFTSLSTSSWS